MRDNFYNNLDLTYPEVGVLLEDAVMKYNKKEHKWIRKKAKVMIPILTPELNSKDMITKTVRASKFDIESSNYFELWIPKYLYPAPEYIKRVPVEYLPGTPLKDKVLYKYTDQVCIEKGTKLIIAFVSGSLEMHNIKVIGLFDDEGDTGEDDPEYGLDYGWGYDDEEEEE